MLAVLLVGILVEFLQEVFVLTLRAWAVALILHLEHDQDDFSA